MSFEAWIDSLKGLYPGGIPLRCIAEARHGQDKGTRILAGTPESRVLFLATLDPASRGLTDVERLLFDAMACKGLRLEEGEAALLNISPGTTAEQLKKELAEFKALCGIVLGRKVPGAEKLKSGNWNDFFGLPAVITSSLSEIISDQGLKRPVWEELKLVLGKLNE